jgi:glutamate/tyrosine decarboxylase-like PLP-dependent enzyme
VVVARTAALGERARRAGNEGRPLTGYASAGVHGCVTRAFEICGLGAQALRLIPMDDDFRISAPALRRRIAADRAAGCTPLIVVGTAGSVDVGAVDDLSALATICRDEAIWFHVDAAFGALAMLCPELRPLFAGIGQADSVAFDFHKWAQVPYDAGCLIVRDPRLHQAAFAGDAAYLRRDARGLAAGAPWPVDLGPELSRGFRALKVWMTLKAYGTDRLAGIVRQCCDLARLLAERIDAAPDLERLAPVALNIVCFRHRGGDDQFQTELAADLQLEGELVLSITTIGGRLALRAAFVNHRTTAADIPAIVRAVLAAAEIRLAKAYP